MRDTVWLKVAPGVKVEVEYDVVDYQMTEGGYRRIRGRMTGAVSMTRDV